VPAGDLGSWATPPFEAIEREGFLYGRGVADMKGSLAAMVAASHRLLQSRLKLKGSLAFLITSDEEGPAINGTVKVMEVLEARGEHINWCLVGEPSSAEKLGDCVRVGRRGSLGFELKIHGIQGHVAYPEKADNPIHKIADFLNQMTKTVWDKGNDFFPATSFQFSNIHGGTGATNVIPGHVQLSGNFRFSTESGAASLKSRTEAILKACALSYDLEWTLSGEPFLTQGGELIKAACLAIEKNCALKPELSTGGGTSDGRFIAPYGVEVLELGPVNATIHKVNESLDIGALYKLSDCYFDILQTLLTDG
jgi:succinyl-diaminopimelate desuccinylase